MRTPSRGTACDAHMPCPRDCSVSPKTFDTHVHRCPNPATEVWVPAWMLIDEVYLCGSCAEAMVASGEVTSRR